MRGAAALDREVEDPSARRAVLFVRGILSASKLGLYTVGGGIGAFLALLPAALSPAPRGRTASASSPPSGPAAEANREPLAG